ncbi:MAG: hypothetical protein FD145_860 [Candidatus Saganbacteria bacterium]|uniref:Uncharacterized protein n=1 Tax=Candidatus Saganbacteria bacterium TaxID=2575572 RepID=A0A833L3I1_UNCSA|nr:MAG: hypothetical protein FD145_860 [Candidatus Saganbacteria bacterium]
MFTSMGLLQNGVSREPHTEVWGIYEGKLLEYSPDFSLGCIMQQSLVY